MNNSLFDLKGKRAFITGATHGLGMAMAKGLAQAGAQLIINGTNPQRMEQALAVYKTEGLSVHSYLFDVTSEKEAEYYIDKIETDIGPIDILVNNAGIIQRVPLIDMKVEDYRKI